MGRIYFLKTPEKKTIFPVTRAEAVLYENTTLDKAISTIHGEISELKNGNNIPRIKEVQIDVIVSTDVKE